MGNDLRDNTILFAKHHIQQAFGVEPKILLGQEKWLHTDESGLLWRVKAYRFSTTTGLRRAEKCLPRSHSVEMPSDDFKVEFTR